MLESKEEIFMTNLDSSRGNYTSSLVVLSTLFCMWGLITVTNFMLIEELMLVFQLNVTEANVINLAFFGTYFILAVPSGKLINSIGYKNGIIAGIVTAGLGCMLFYPAAENRSYAMVLLAMFVLGAGITILQVGANAYVVLIGQRNLSASRLNLVQAFNSAGTMLAPLLTTGLFMKIANYSPENLGALSPDEYRAAAAAYVQLPYLTLGAIMFLLALLVGFSKLPKIVTHEMEPLVKEPAEGSRKFILQFPHLVMGAIAIFAYVGAEVSIGRFLTINAEHIVVYYWGGAMVGRFIGAYILVNMSPRKLIGLSSLVSVSLVLVYVLSGSASDTSYWPLVMIGLFNSILFPSLFAMGIDGLGRFSEEGSSILIMSIVGGAIVPFVFAIISESAPLTAFVIPVICYLFIAYYGFKASVYPKKAKF